MNTETIKSIERHVDRLQTEHLQMLGMLEQCRLYFRTLGVFSGLSQIQTETVLEISKEIEELIGRVRKK